MIAYGPQAWRIGLDATEGIHKSVHDMQFHNRKNYSLQDPGELPDIAQQVLSQDDKVMQSGLRLATVEDMCVDVISLDDFGL